MRNPSAAPLILASTSVYRRDLLQRFIDDFEVIAPLVDEKAITAPAPEDLAALLARTKAQAVVTQHKKAVIIGADQVAVLDGTVIGKPGEHARAVDQLLAASGKSMEFLTAVCVLDVAGRRCLEHVDRTVVHFREFDRRLVDIYLERDKPYDCAGSFKVEGAGPVLFWRIDSEDPTGLMGLPMIWLAETLRSLGQLLP